MHGLIHLELNKYVVERRGAEVWQDVLARAGFRDKIYRATETYSDAETMALFEAASQCCGLAQADLLRDYGTFIVADLIKMYWNAIKPGWRTLEFLLYAEEAIHRTVRRRDPAAQPPQLQIERTSPTQVRIVYSSGRKLCSMLIGMVSGVAAYYAEEATVAQTQCMLDGADSCIFSVTV